MVQESKALLAAMNDRNVSLKFVKRSANDVAHYLARSSFHFDGVIQASGALSECISVLTKDLTQ